MSASTRNIPISSAPQSAAAHSVYTENKICERGTDITTFTTHLKVQSHLGGLGMLDQLLETDLYYTDCVKITVSTLGNSSSL